MQIGNHSFGDLVPYEDHHIPAYPYIVAAAGGNHNASLAKALALCDMAKAAGASAIKFQKRTPEKCVPRDQWDERRTTPWGYMTYIAYRHMMEFGKNEYDAISDHCGAIGLDWFVSVWDVESVDFMEQYEPIAYKIPSACLTDDRLLERIRDTGRPKILSTGMSWPQEIMDATKILSPKDGEHVILCQTTSSYPTPPREVQLNYLPFLRGLGPSGGTLSGYSGHEQGWIPTLGAVALGAVYIERHFTDDKSQWGSDQSISLEPSEFTQMVADIRAMHVSLGAGVKKVWKSELRAMDKLRLHTGRIQKKAKV